MREKTIPIRLSQDEYDTLKSDAIQEGFKDVSKLIRHRLFSEPKKNEILEKLETIEHKLD